MGSAFGKKTEGQIHAIVNSDEVSKHLRGKNSSGEQKMCSSDAKNKKGGKEENEFYRAHTKTGKTTASDKNAKAHEKSYR